jgi:predicted amidohydrolase YtcJ
MANLIFFNANVITLDPAHPKAQLVAIKNGKILSVTTNDKLKKHKKSDTKVVDCNSKTILPGFIDTHIHLHSFAESFVTLNLGPHNNLRSISGIQRKIRELSQQLPEGTWIRGRGYNEFHLAEKKHPNRWDLDAITTIHPMKLTHRTGHAHVLNSLALKLVGISKETPDPPGGLIERDVETGEPTGLLYQMSDLLSKRIPPLENMQLDLGMKIANRELVSSGITSVQDASSHNGILQWKLFNKWKTNGLLKPRLTMMLGFEGFKEHRDQNFSTQLNETHFRLGGVKIILDGTTGQFRPNQAELNEMVLNIHQSGSQACLHAIEEYPIEAACTAIEYALKKSPKSDHRHRIEHCSVCPPSLAKRLASLGILVVTQPSFIYYSGERYLRTVPSDQLKCLYPIATLMRSEVTVAGSSDCPIAPPNPLMGIYAATSRKADSGERILPEERITPDEALRMYTEVAAKASFEEKNKGTISPGKLADLVVLNSDPTKLPIDEIKDIDVEMTILDGEIVWDKQTNR